MHVLELLLLVLLLLLGAEVAVVGALFAIGYLCGNIGGKLIEAITHDS